MIDNDFIMARDQETPKLTSADAVDDLLNLKQLRDRAEEIKQIIDRLDMLWDMEFMNKEEYLQKRPQ